MVRQRVMTGTPMLKALACGMLEDGGRILFLFRTNEKGLETFEIPSVVVRSGRSPFAEIKEAFRKMTGIDGEVHEIILEGRYNAGSRRKRIMIPALIFKITARERFAKPSVEFKGFRWMSFEDAKKQKLSKSTEWLRNVSLRTRKPNVGDLPENKNSK